MKRGCQGTCALVHRDALLPNLAEAREDCRRCGGAELAALQPFLQGVPEKNGALDAHSHSLSIDRVKAGSCIAHHTQPLWQLHLHSRREQLTEHMRAQAGKQERNEEDPLAIRATLA